MKPPPGGYHTLACALLLLGTGAAARPRPKLTKEAQAALASGPALVLPEDNQLVPLGGGKPLTLIDPAPTRLELVDARFLIVDDELFRFEGGRLQRVAQGVGAQPAVSADRAWFAWIVDKRTLELSHAGTVRRIDWKHDGQWELERPWLSDDGAFALVALHEYGQPIDAYSFLVVPTAGGAASEVSLEQGFAPGWGREAVSATRVALPVFVQKLDDAGQVAFSESDPVVFDLAARKLERAPSARRVGMRSPSGRFVLVVSEHEVDRCRAGETRIYEREKTAPSVFRVPGKTVVPIDFLPDESGLIAAVIDKSCRTRGAIVPLTGDAAPEKWKPFPLPPQKGVVRGRVVGGP